MSGMNSKYYVSWLDMLEPTEWLFLMKPFFQQFQNMEEGSSIGKEEIYNTLVNSQGAMEAQKKMQEDMRWADAMFVLVAYKTEQCKRAPRLCRQGYACPNYHNSKDRRRSPKIWKYRSTPCPVVKSNDEWGDPNICEKSDQCQYCHTRTEQQFHPEIYKSTRCKDMQQYMFCPRGPFCAFAHDDDEAQNVYDISDTQYPDTTSPPGATNTGGMLGDKRSRSYTHSGLALETRVRSDSNDSRIRSLSLIDSLQNMTIAPPPLASAAHAAALATENRIRSQSQGSAENNVHVLAPELLESSPRAGGLAAGLAVGLTGGLADATKAATLAAVQQQQLTAEQQTFYSPAGLPTPAVGGAVNGHYAMSTHAQQHAQHPVPGGLPADYSAAAAVSQPPPGSSFPDDYSMMLNGLLGDRRKVEQAVLDNARILQQHQEQQRVLINDSLETVKAIGKLTNNLLYNANKLPLNILVVMKQQFARTIEDINGTIADRQCKDAVRKQMSCMVCKERIKDALTQPCSHFVACQECLKTHKFCPYCNELIQRIFSVCI